MRCWTNKLVIGATCALILSVMSPVFANEDELPPPSTTTTTTTAAPTTTVPTDEEAEPDPKPTRKPPNPVKRIDVLRKLTFPVVGPSYFYPSFGACRDNCSREHFGNDIMTWSWKGLPVVAATDGAVTRITLESDGGKPGCSVIITDPRGWQTRYYHLNTDMPGTDEPGAACPVPGLRVGSTVQAGQIIGYIGDSGNAEDTPAHIHFELRTRSSFPVDPYRSLKRAERIEYEILPANFSEATLLLSEHVKPRDADTTIVVTTDEADQLMSSEERSIFLGSPLVAIDPDNLQAGLDEIERLDSTAISIVSDLDVRWLQNLLRERAQIVERQPMPVFDEKLFEFIPDSVEAPTPQSNPGDAFSTIIAGATDRIYKSRQAPFREFAADHRALVIESDQWAPRNIGHGSWRSPGRWADQSKVWWGTGAGWVGTDPDAPAPEFGYAYLSERRVNNSTLTFLGSLAEVGQFPIWRSR